MILTVTMNPSVDIIYFTERLAIGHNNRCTNVLKIVGGKGINVARTISLLDERVIAMGISAGDNGKLIEKKIAKEESFETIFIRMTGESRNAITIMDQDKNQTELVEEGPLVSTETAEKMLQLIEATAKKQQPSVIAISGSVHSENDYLYQEYIEQLSSTLPSVKILADLSGRQLLHVLEGRAQPFFIKPNLKEFGELIGQSLNNKSKVLQHIHHPLLKDVPFILISCGSEGAIAKYGEQIFDIGVPTIDIINPTGSGDATVGGIAYALAHHFTIEDTLKYGMACGTNNAMEEKIGFVEKKRILSLLNKIELKEII